MKELLRQVYQQLPFKQELFTLAKRFHRPPEAIYRHLSFRGVFSVDVEGKSFLLKHHGFQVENCIFWDGLLSPDWEGASMALWVKLCKTAHVVIDGGANTGVYSLVCKALNPAAKVYAFEPVQRVHSKLVENCRLNGFDIQCVDKALSNSDGTATIYDLPSEHVYSVTVNKNLNAPDVDTRAVTITTVRLDTFLAAQDQMLPVDLMKLDVETHEPEVLEGFGKFLEQMRPTMLIEILTQEVAAKVEALVTGKGYLYFNIDDVRGPRRQERLTKSDHYNFLLCSAEKAKELGLD
jgi:FkbM family methyltransferase